MIRLIHLTVTQIQHDIVACFEVNEQVVTWKARSQGRMYRHVIWLGYDDEGGEPELAHSCGFERMSELLRGRFGGEECWWDFLATVLRDAQLDRLHLRRWRDEAYDEGWRNASRAMHRAISKREERAERRRGCFLYLMSGLGRLKIGYSHDPRKRARSLGSSFMPPSEVVVLAKRRFGSESTARTAEREAHEHFAAHRLHGEWFTDVPEIRAWFGVP